MILLRTLVNGASNMLMKSCRSFNVWRPVSYIFKIVPWKAFYKLSLLIRKCGNVDPQITVIRRRRSGYSRIIPQTKPRFLNAAEKRQSGGSQSERQDWKGSQSFLQRRRWPIHVTAVAPSGLLVTLKKISEVCKTVWEPSWILRRARLRHWWFMYVMYSYVAWLNLSPCWSYSRKSSCTAISPTSADYYNGGQSHSQKFEIGGRLKKLRQTYRQDVRNVPTNIIWQRSTRAYPWRWESTVDSRWLEPSGKSKRFRLPGGSIEWPEIRE